MAVLDKTTFDTTYADSAGTFADNTTRLISEGDLRQFADDISDSLVFGQAQTSQTTDLGSYDILTTTVFSPVHRTIITILTADVLSANASPVEVVPAPDADHILTPIMFFVYLDYNSAAYGTNTTFRFEMGGVPVSSTNTTILPGTADRMVTMIPIAVDTTTDLSATPIVFEVQGGNPTTGNSPIYVTCIYSITYKGLPPS